MHNAEIDKAERKAAASAFVIHVFPDPFLYDFDNYCQQHPRR